MPASARIGEGYILGLGLGWQLDRAITVDGRVDQLVAEKTGEVVAELSIPFGESCLWIISVRLSDDRLVDGRVERRGRRLDHKHIGIVFAVVVAVAGVKQPLSPVGRADADQHSASGGKSWKYGAIGFNIWNR
jgi:hypothetical protein